MATLTERLDPKIADLDAAIVKTQQNAAGEIARIRSHIAVLNRAKAAVTPANEALVADLKGLGVL